MLEQITSQTLHKNGAFSESCKEQREHDSFQKRLEGELAVPRFYVTATTKYR
jgi:hypothetical protein